MLKLAWPQIESPTLWEPQKVSHEGSPPSLKGKDGDQNCNALYRRQYVAKGETLRLYNYLVVLGNCLNATVPKSFVSVLSGASCLSRDHAFLIVNWSTLFQSSSESCGKMWFALSRVLCEEARCIFVARSLRFIEPASSAASQFRLQISWAENRLKALRNPQYGYSIAAGYFCLRKGELWWPHLTLTTLCPNKPHVDYLCGSELSFQYLPTCNPHDPSFI